MVKIGLIKEFERRYRDEWLLIEVLEEDQKNIPLKGRLISHSKSRDEINEISRQLKGNICIFFAGDIPKKGYAFCF